MIHPTIIHPSLLIYSHLSSHQSILYLSTHRSLIHPSIPLLPHLSEVEYLPDSTPGQSQHWYTVEETQANADHPLGCYPWPRQQWVKCVPESGPRGCNCLEEDGAPGPCQRWGSVQTFAESLCACLSPKNTCYLAASPSFSLTGTWMGCISLGTSFEHSCPPWLFCDHP